MSDHEKAIKGVVVTQGERVYFIPQRILDGFSVEHPAGQEALRKSIANAPAHNAYSVTLDRGHLHQEYIF